MSEFLENLDMLNRIINELRDENAKLKEAVTELTEENRLVGLQMDRFADEIGRLRAENAKLKEAVTELTEENRLVGLQMDRFADENEKLCDEIHLLRTALKPFAEYEFDDMDEDEDETASPFILMKHLRAVRAAMGESDE